MTPAHPESAPAALPPADVMASPANVAVGGGGVAVPPRPGPARVSSPARPKSPPIQPASPEERASVRRMLAKRLSDVICIPASQLPPQERHMAGDVLVELLRDADIDLRESVAKRLVMLNEAPRTILVMLAKDHIHVARHVLEGAETLTDSDLIQIVHKVSRQHRQTVAQRRHIADAVVDALVQYLEEDVVETLLSNKGASFSETALQRILVVSRSHQPYVKLLIKRDELRPSHGLTMFWWANAENRKQILRRFGVTRNVLQESCHDLYPLAARDGWQDPAVRKALQFIERRQRNRAAIARSEYENIEDAIDHATREGLTRKLTEEISYMSGVKPATGAQILTDRGGEALAILMKAPGLKREHLVQFWQALGRKTYSEDGGKDVYHPDLQRVIATYDAVSTDKAQTILRYWNWSLTSALNADILRHIKNGVIPREEDYGAAAITASLVFTHRPQD